MKPEQLTLAALALATLCTVASPRPADRYRNVPSSADGADRAHEADRADEADRVTSPRPVDPYRNVPSSASRARGADRARGDDRADRADRADIAIDRRRHAWARGERRKRGYSPWMVRSDRYEGYDNYPTWQQQMYQPAYVIPVFATSPERRPSYFRPRPFDLNPGFPPDNPVKRPYRGPGYLPPRRPTTAKPTTTTTKATKVVDRFAGDDDDDRPIWGGAMDAPAAGGTPTRPPRPPNMPDFPPLVHSIGSHDEEPFVNQLSMDSEEESAVFPIPSTVRPGAQQSTGRRITTTTTSTTTTTPRPEFSGPSNCVWAVVSCCSASSSQVAENCFEQRGCPGPFWDSSPCDSDFARAAISSALNYYNQL